MFMLQPFPVRLQMYSFHECISRHCITFIDFYFFFGVTERIVESFWQTRKQKAAKNKQTKCNLAAQCIMEPYDPSVDTAAIENGWMESIMETCGLHLLRQLILREASETRRMLRCPSCGEDYFAESFAASRERTCRDACHGSDAAIYAHVSDAETPCLQTRPRPQVSSDRRRSPPRACSSVVIQSPL